MARRHRFFKKRTMRKIWAASLAAAAALLVAVNSEFSLDLPMVPTWEEILEAAGNYGMENLSSSSSQPPQGGESSPSSDAPLPELLGETLEVHIIDVGQGESILIKGPSKNVLIDAGENDKGDEVLAYLKANGVKSLDMAIGTHAHSDHIGGLDTVIKSIPVKQVILSPIPKKIVPTTKTYTDLLEAVLDKGLTVTTAVPDTQYSLGGGAVLTILGPRREYNDLNNTSVVCRLTYGDAEFLFSGDAETASESTLLSMELDLSADVYCVPHHGSSTSSSKRYLDAVDPKIATISVGRNNDYGHPHKEIVARLKKYCPFYRTDLSGNIQIITDGETINLTTDAGESCSVAA